MLAGNQKGFRAPIPSCSHRLLNSGDLTVYKFDHSAVDGNPEARFKCLKKLVGERGFEPPTPWSRINHRNAISLIRLAWLCVTDHGSMRFSARN